jgi:hypothetical protein
VHRDPPAKERAKIEGVLNRVVIENSKANPERVRFVKVRHFVPTRTQKPSNLSSYLVTREKNCSAIRCVCF